MALSAPAWAQTAPAAQQGQVTAPAQDPDEDEAVVDEIVVTGSRIARPQYEGTIPGVQVGEQDIEERLFTNAGDILNDIPLVGAGASLNGTNGGQSASLGVTFIDLLNLGTARTLTLVNGRRFVSNNSATIFVSGNETGSQVDASTIPVALIDRVDVLTVGGAAAYGADAVSGVVNYILKDDYEGFEASVIGGQTFEHEDAGRVSVNATAGKSFLDGRLNLAVSAEYSSIEGLLGSERDFRRDNQGGISNFRNGGIRNSAFVPGGLGSLAFLSGATDGAPGTIFADRRTTNSNWFGGVVFFPTSANGTAENTALAALPVGTSSLVAGAVLPGGMPGTGRVLPPGTGFSISTALQLVPGAPNLCNAGAFSAAQAAAAAALNPRVCNFAPSALPGATAAAQAATAARVFTFYGVAPPSGTQAQINAAALQLLQSRNPTAREYYAANPSTNLNAFLGSFIPGLPDVANTGPGSAFLPRLAVPLRFDSSGNVVPYVFGEGGPEIPGTFGTSVGGDGPTLAERNVLRVKQERYVGNFLGRFDITDNIEFFTENLYSTIDVETPYFGGLANAVTTTTTENAGLLFNVTHPFLTDQNRADLAARGITGNFTLSRYNSDLIDDTTQYSTNETFRSVNGLRGDFTLFDRDFGWELSHSYGRADTTIEYKGIKDVEYALSLDAVNVGGQIRCRAQVVGLANYLAGYGGQIPGINLEVISEVGADGIRQQRTFRGNATQELVDACVPLNPFGEGRASAEAKAYVTTDLSLNNESTQNFTQGIFTGELFDLPAGPLQFALSGEYRKEELVFFPGEIDRQGRAHGFAPSATTNAEVTTKEAGLELNIPIFGGDFTLPFVQSLEINPSVRYSQLDGSGESFRNIAGELQTPSYEGETQEIYTIAGTWEINDQLLLRGNISKSVRQPSIVELFLGGQPFFTSAADPCSNSNIALGPNPTARRANCIAAVIANGNAADEAGATTFLASYVPTGAAFNGLISGITSLQPEEGDSFTYGFVARPDFIPNLIFAADYLEITVSNLLGPLLATPAANFCFDSPTYPDPTPQIGVDSCAGLVRDSTFNFTDGSVLPFFNLGGTRVKAINANASYSVDVADVFSADRDLGTFGLRGNAYYLLEYSQSGSGNFDDSQSQENTLANPTWSTQITALYDIGRFGARWTTEFQSASRVKSAGTPITPETQSIIRYDAYWYHTLSLDYDVTENTTARVVIDNVTDEAEIGRSGYLNNQFIDNIGRRWTASLTVKF